LAAVLDVNGELMVNKQKKLSVKGALPDQLQRMRRAMVVTNRNYTKSKPDALDIGPVSIGTSTPGQGLVIGWEIGEEIAVVLDSGAGCTGKTTQAIK
jgi:hypothetical protein